MKIKNINGRRQSSCKCGTWLDHWVKLCGQPRPERCSEIRCMAKAELGAHVQKDCDTDTNWYIIPLCVKHSLRADFLEISETAILVSAHVADTCGRQRPIGHVWPHELRTTLAANAAKHGAPQDWLDHAIAKSKADRNRKQITAKRPPLRQIY